MFILLFCVQYLNATRFMALFPGLSGWAGARRKSSGLLWCKGE